MNEKQSIFERIKLYIIKPSVFFEKYKENPKYLFHLIVLIIISIATGLISMNVSREALNGASDSLTGSEAELVSGIMGFMTSPITIILGTIVTSLIGFYLMSLIYYVIVGMIFKGEGKFNHMMILVLLTSYPTKLLGLVKSFFPITDIKTLNLMKTITSYVNIFSLWGLFLLIIGTTVLFNMSKKKAATIYIVLFIIGLLFVLGSYSLGNATAALQ